jgi:RecJ-like exonuclease
MDCYCAKCGEPWESDCLYTDVCPTCKGHRTKKKSCSECEGTGLVGRDALSAKEIYRFAKGEGCPACDFGKGTRCEQCAGTGEVRTGITERHYIRPDRYGITCQGCGKRDAGCSFGEHLSTDREWRCTLCAQKAGWTRHDKCEECGGTGRIPVPAEGEDEELDERRARATAAMLCGDDVDGWAADQD